MLAMAGLFSGISHTKTCFCDVSITQPSSVQSSRWDEAIFLVTPGTSCLATVRLSLRDKIHPPAEALLKLTAYGVYPGLAKKTFLAHKALGR